MAYFMHFFEIDRIAKLLKRAIMALQKEKSLDSQILEELLREEIRNDPEKKPVVAPCRNASTVGPHWHVEEAKETPFVSDFFFSHPDKILGI